MTVQLTRLPLPPHRPVDRSAPRRSSSRLWGRDTLASASEMALSVARPMITDAVPASTSASRPRRTVTCTTAISGFAQAQPVAPRHADGLAAANARHLHQALDAPLHLDGLHAGAEQACPRPLKHPLEEAFQIRDVCHCGTPHQSALPATSGRGYAGSTQPLYSATSRKPMRSYTARPIALDCRIATVAPAATPSAITRRVMASP